MWVLYHLCQAGLKKAEDGGTMEEEATQKCFPKKVLKGEEEREGDGGGWWMMVLRAAV